MAETEQLSQEQHKKQGIQLFNLVWEYLEKPERTVADNDTMLNAAHASRYHWSLGGTTLNIARGEWQISRVYSVLKRAEPALYHANRCLQLCQENGYGDFDLAFAYEALARGYTVAGNTEEAGKYLALGKEAGEKIQEEDDRKLFFSDLATVQTA